MLSKPQVPAPEPCASAALWVLYRVVLFIRNEADSISPQQLSDLGRGHPQRAGVAHRIWPLLQRS